MKAIAVIVIAGGIGSGEIAAAGLILGVLFLVLGYGRCFSVIEKWVPESVVRGIQLGLALLLFKASMDFVITDSILFCHRYRHHRGVYSLCPLQGHP